MATPEPAQSMNSTLRVAMAPIKFGDIRRYAWRHLVAGDMLLLAALVGFLARGGWAIDESWLVDGVLTMKRSFVLGIVVAMGLLGSPALAQDVVYEKLQLDNGLTVILHEDHSLPVACVNLWYYVGSKDEPTGRSGFAHLFEHLMFMGTERVPGLDFDNTMEAGGGRNNASTSEDRTNYFESGPANLLPTLLWLEADRLEALGRMMNQKKLDLQREVVRNERRQSYENRPYGKAALKVYGLMFPEGHPYHIPVIGTHADLESATVSDVKNFFANYYVPNNGSLVVAGDFDPATVKPLIAKLFGTLPRGDDVIHRDAKPVRLDGVTRLTMTDKVQYAKTTMVYHSPRHFQPGDAEMDLAGAILADGISSRLYQKLVYENDLAVDVSAYQSSMLLGSLFYIEAIAKPGVSLDTIENAIDAAVADFTSKGPTAAELERQKATTEYGMVSRLSSILAKADRLNAYNFHMGEPDGFKRDLDRYRDATVRGVRDVARSVLTPDARLILRVVPVNPSDGPNPRDDKPVLAEAARFLPKAPESFTLSNGIRVHHWRRPELPMMVTAMSIKGGAETDGSDRAGRANLTADMLDEGAGGLSAVAFSEALDALGAQFRAGCDYEFTTATMSVLSRNYDRAMKLYADAILRPNFDEKEWQRVKRLHIAGLKRAQDNPVFVAGRVSMRTFFGDSHPYGRPSAGTIRSVEGLSLDAIKAGHAGIYQPSRATLFVAGDLPADQVKRTLENALGGWRDAPGHSDLASPSYPPPVNHDLRVVIVDKPGAVQTVVRFTMPADPYATPNRAKLLSLNTILGGSFTSRLNKNLREDHGYTYGARSGFSLDNKCGYFTASSSVRADVTGASLAEFLKEFKSIRGGTVSAVEATKARETRRTNVIQSIEGLGGLIGTAVNLHEHNQPFSALGQDLTNIAAVQREDLNGLAKGAIPLEKGLLVLVGDKSLILEQTKDLPLPKPVEMTVAGEEKR